MTLVKNFNNILVNTITNNSTTATFITNITTSNIVATNFTSTNIFNTNLTSTNILNTNFTSTNILNTNITTSNIVATNFTGSNIVATNFTSTNIFNTNLTSSNILNTNLTTNSLIVNTNAKFNCNVSMSNFTVTGLNDPVALTDAATKNYVDNKLAAKTPVSVATTTAGTLATSFANGQTIDAITLTTGMRILVKNQATATENGIYTVNASGAPTRTLDFATGSAQASSYTFVNKGTTNADTLFTCTNDPGSDIVGTNNLAFSQISGGGGGGTNSFSLDDISAPIVFNMTNNTVSPTNVTSFTFPNSIAFTAYVLIKITATSSLFQQSEIRGIKNSSGWSITEDYIGDTSNVTFTINTSTGQILYTCSNYSGFTSGKIVFRATCIGGV